LLHEGSGSAAVNAFVEVVFDNSDHRFSLENSDEVVLRRTVGSKKDEFFLQRKRATKQEVQSLLEGAGFSKSNPYFMVQQGKIQTLCTMTDVQRLQLLQQVAGTTLYEDKKSESLSKMQENAQSIEKIQTILGDLDQKLSELKGEKEELSQYQKCDRSRKALEYTLYDKELRKARHSLDHLEHERTEHVQQLTQLHERAKTTHDAIQNAEASLKLKSASLKRNRTTLQRHLETENTRAVTLKTKLQLTCQELQEQVVLGKETLELTKQELQSLQQQIATAKQALAKIEARVQQQSSAVMQSTQERDAAQRQMDAIYAKQGRGRQYSTKQERDRVLQNQIQELQDVKMEKEQHLVQQRDALANVRRTIVSEEQELTSKRAEIQTTTGSLQSLSKALDEKSKNRLALHETRKQYWRQAEELQDKTREAREAMHKAIGDMRKSMPRATSMGLKALQNIVEEERLVVGEQYFGMLMDNMTLRDPKYQTAVEVAAQNSLFHVVVDSDATAARLMKRLEDDKSGRVTFLPLNRVGLHTGQTQYPQSPDVTPLLDVCLDCDPKVARAMQHVFDKKLLARTPEVASEWSSKVHMDCITLEGDFFSRKGALTGGYVDHSKSRLRAYSNQTAAQRAFHQVEKEFREMDVQAKAAEQEVTNASSEVSRLQHKREKLQRVTQDSEAKVSQIETQLDLHKKQAQKLETQTLPPLEREIDAAKGDMARLEEEIGTELQHSLSDGDRGQLTQLKQVHSQLKADIQAQQEALDEVSVEQKKLLSLLDDNLLKRREELTTVKDTEGGPTTSSLLQEQRARDLTERQQQLEEATRAADDIEQRLEQARQVEEDTKSDLIAAKNELEKFKSADMKTTKLLEDASERSEKLMSKVRIVSCLQQGMIGWILCVYCFGISHRLFVFVASLRYRNP
jgi:structural maintenance of chromosome 3 (chondroitin sulfate proteoglycan 6)